MSEQKEVKELILIPVKNQIGRDYNAINAIPEKSCTQSDLDASQILNHIRCVPKSDFDAVVRERDNFKKCYEIRMNNIIKIEADFASSVISNQGKDAEIQRLRDLLNKAKAYIDASPCDPDITAEQTKAWLEYQDALKELGEL